MLRAVLFDLDGTLMDHDAARSAGLQGHLRDWLPGVDADELARLEEEWQRLETIHYDEYTRGECTLADQRRRRVRGLAAALEREPRQALTPDAWFASYLSHYRTAWRAFDDVLPALGALLAANPKIVLGVVTNGEGEPQRAKLAAIGLSGRFEVVVASGEEGVAKPDAEIFARACERLGVERWQTAHVGDRLDLDAEGAAAAGLHGIWLDRIGAAAGGASLGADGPGPAAERAELAADRVVPATDRGRTAANRVGRAVDRHRAAARGAGIPTSPGCVVRISTMHELPAVLERS